MAEEIKHLKTKVKRAPTNYKGFNVKEDIQNCINFLENNRIDFVEITFVQKKEMSGYY